MSVTREKEKKTYRWLTIVFTCGELYRGIQTPQRIKEKIEVSIRH